MIVLNVYELTYINDNYSFIRTGLNPGKVRADEYSNYCEADPDITFIQFARKIRCRKIGQSIPMSAEAPFANQDRIDIINHLIREIGSRSHRSLYYPKEDRYAAFHWAGGRLWFTDQYTNLPMIMEPETVGKTREQRKRFSSGGTMWGLVNDFRDFIFGDDDANHNNGYGGLYCHHWGYPPEDMAAIRNKAVELGYLKPMVMV